MNSIPSTRPRLRRGLRWLFWLSVAGNFVLLAAVALRWNQQRATRPVPVPVAQRSAQEMAIYQTVLQRLDPPLDPRFILPGQKLPPVYLGTNGRNPPMVLLNLLNAGRRPWLPISQAPAVPADDIENPVMPTDPLAMQQLVRLDRLRWLSPSLVELIESHTHQHRQTGSSSGMVRPVLLRHEASGWVVLAEYHELIWN